jgi:hypothetical protein
MADELDDVAIVDVTAEVVGERRVEWQAGVDYGLKQGTNRFLQSPAMQQIAFDLTLHRLVVDGMLKVAEERERLLAHWKAEAQWWREERDRIHAEFCEYAKAIERKFLKP